MARTRGAKRSRTGKSPLRDTTTKDKSGTSSDSDSDKDTPQNIKIRRSKRQRSQLTIDLDVAKSIVEQACRNAAFHTLEKTNKEPHETYDNSSDHEEPDAQAEFTRFVSSTLLRAIASISSVVEATTPKNKAGSSQEKWTEPSNIPSAGTHFWSRIVREEEIEDMIMHTNITPIVKNTPPMNLKDLFAEASEQIEQETTKLPAQTEEAKIKPPRKSRVSKKELMALKDDDTSVYWTQRSSRRKKVIEASEQTEQETTKLRRSPTMVRGVEHAESLHTMCSIFPVVMASVESSLEDPVGHAMATASANAHEPPTDNGSESSSDYFTSSEFDEDHSHGNSHISNDSSHSDLLPPVGDTDSSSMALDDDNYEFFSDEKQTIVKDQNPRGHRYNLSVQIVNEPIRPTPNATPTTLASTIAIPISLPLSIPNKPDKNSETPTNLLVTLPQTPMNLSDVQLPDLQSDKIQDRIVVDDVTDDGDFTVTDYHHSLVGVVGDLGCDEDSIITLNQCAPIMENMPALGKCTVH